MLKYVLHGLKFESVYCWESYKSDNIKQLEGFEENLRSVDQPFRRLQKKSTALAISNENILFDMVPILTQDHTTLSTQEPIPS